jgi:hypothetical protein
MSVKVTIETSALTLGKSEHKKRMSDRWYVAELIADLVDAYDAAQPPTLDKLGGGSLRGFLLARLQEKEKAVDDV